MAHPPDRLKRIQEGGVSGHQDVEEVAQRREGLVLGRRSVGELIEEPAGQAGRDLVQLQPLVLAPSEKPVPPGGRRRSACAGWRSAPRRTHRPRSRPPCRLSRGWPGSPLGGPFVRRRISGSEREFPVRHKMTQENQNDRKRAAYRSRASLRCLRMRQSNADAAGLCS